MIYGIAPAARVVDLSHQIPAFDIRAGAWVLASSLPWAPVGTHVAVVDPGVGTDRLLLVLRCERGDVLVGPDNGLLMPAADRLGGVAEARRITNEGLMLHPVSATFHGRDIFSPVAAHLAAGVPFSEVGPVIEAGSLVPAPWSQPVYSERSVAGEVVLLDSFGNVRTNIESALWPVTPGESIRVYTAAGEHEARVARTFGEVVHGELFAFDDSSNYICLAVNLGGAGERLHIESGDRLELERL